MAIDISKLSRRAMADALEQIAKTPLWGEPVPNDDNREQALAYGEYDADEGYQPSADTESTLLRDAVETARQVLGLPTSVDMLEPLDAIAEEQAAAQGVSRAGWAQLMEDCSEITETDEVDGRV